MVGVRVVVFSFYLTGIGSGLGAGSTSGVSVVGVGSTVG